MRRLCWGSALKTRIFPEFKYHHQSANTATEHKQTEIYYTPWHTIEEKQYNIAPEMLDREGLLLGTLKWIAWHRQPLPISWCLARRHQICKCSWGHLYYRERADKCIRKNLSYANSIIHSVAHEAAELPFCIPLLTTVYSSLKKRREKKPSTERKLQVNHKSSILACSAPCIDPTTCKKSLLIAFGIDLTMQI